MIVPVAGYAKNFPIVGKNELSGGIGFSGGLVNYSTSGFKWFNDYSRKLGKLVWLNFQFNVTAAGSSQHCTYDKQGRLITCYPTSRYGHGNALELVAGVKLKWRLKKIPLQIHAKFGGAFDILFLGDGFTGFGMGLRAGAGVKYFFVPTFGVGAELVNTLGPAFFNRDMGVQFMGFMDFNAGIEWRF